MSRSVATAVVLGFLVAVLSQTSCSDDGGAGAVQFCGRVASECMLEVTVCDDLVDRETIDHPGCDDVRDDMLDCALDQDPWSCPDSSTLYAGASYMSGGRGYAIQGYTVWLPPSCDAEGDAWESCKVCGPGGSRTPVEPPGGSYSLSCHDCTMNGSMLACDLCDGVDYGPSQIDVCSCIGDISNKDGNLCCDEGCRD